MIIILKGRTLRKLSRYLVVLLLGNAFVAINSHAQPDDNVESDFVDEGQTMHQINRYTQVARGGVKRGETIYYYKCWTCHNRITEDSGPYLKNIFDRSFLSTGEPVNEDTVAGIIMQGSPRMPGFEHSLSGGMLTDILDYLRSDKCCYEAGDDPPLNPRYRAETNEWPVSSTLRGGPDGTVQSTTGNFLEGIRVQLIAPNGVRTTVYTGEKGRYEFPKMKSGHYDLRIATPIPYKSYRRNDVPVNGSGTLDKIVLEKIPGPNEKEALEGEGSTGTLAPGKEDPLPGALPPEEEILSQLSDAEILWNLSGTAQEKSVFARACGRGCHGYQQIFRNRFDEHGWRAMVDRMVRYNMNILVSRLDAPSLMTEQEVEMTIQWLTKVRGPESESEDPPLRQFPRPNGDETEIVITEYEMPRRLLSIHDVYGDSEGNIWYTSHRTPYQGKLDPDTGVVEEYELPPAPGSVPGAHGVMVDKYRGYVWFSELWARRFSRLDIKTGKFKIFKPDNIWPFNFGLHPDGTIWTNRHSAMGKDIVRMDPESGEIVNAYPLRENPLPYQNALSSDGRFWAGASPTATGANTAMMLDIPSGEMYEIDSGDRVHSGARGALEPNGKDAWVGGRDGVLVQLVNKIEENKGVNIRTYPPPTPYFPYTMFYTMIPDKNGGIWGGNIHGGGFLRYNSKQDKWTVYKNAEPSALSRHVWIDNSTDPVSVWYPDFHTGLIVRIQPRNMQ